MQNTTLVLGASENPARYSNLAIQSLKCRSHAVVAVGKKVGEVEGIPIQTFIPDIQDLHTVTLYLNPQNQKGYYKDILRLKPRRIIFNPGTENEELQKLAKSNGIQVQMDCTILMLTTNDY